MSSPILVFDCHYLAHRAFHTTKNLSHKSKPTGVIFGFLNSITYLKDYFQSDRVVFCFEGPPLARTKLFPEYKLRRSQTKRSPEEQVSYDAFKIQINELQMRYLPQIGFRNVWRVRGMESDDLMACIARDTPETEEIILVTSDQDMFQCLSSNVSIHSPQKQKLITAASFRKEYGIAPRKWAMVKAIAGCHSDGVPGIRGIGETTALKFVRGELPETSLPYKRIMSDKSLVRGNRRLVELPFEGCKVPELKPDEVTKKSWLEVCGLLGMRTISSKPPILSRKLTTYGRMGK